MYVCVELCVFVSGLKHKKVFIYSIHNYLFDFMVLMCYS